MAVGVLDLPTLIQKVRLDADTKDAEKEVQSGTERVGKGMQKFGVGLTAGLTVPIVALAGAGVKAASDLSESNSKVGVVFDENAGKVRAFAKTASTELGISEQAALEATGTFGNLFRALGIGTAPAADMSTSLVKLAGDLASFNNANPEDVLLALKSGLLGEAEPMRAFGVSLSAARIEAEAMSSGLVKATGDVTDIKNAQVGAEKAHAAAAKAMKEHGKDSIEYRDAQAKAQKAEEALSEAIKGKVPELTAAQKAQAAYAIIQKDTTLAQGDFARTSDGLANKQRIVSAQFTDMKATLGTALLPIVQKFVGVLSDVFKWFSELGPTGQKIVGMLTLMAAAAGPVLIVGGKLVQSAKDIAGAAKATVEFGGKVGGFLSEHAKQAADLAGKIASSAADIASSVAKQVASVASAAAEMAVNLAKQVASVVAAGAAQVASFIATAASAVASAAATVAAWAVAAAPFILLGAIVAGVVILIVKNWDTIVDATKAAWNFIKDVTVGVWNFIKDHLAVILQAILVAITGPIGVLVLLIIKNWDTIKDATMAVWNAIKDALAAVWDGIKAAAAFVFDALKAYFEFVFNVYKTIIETVWNVITGILRGAWDGIVAIAKGIWDGLRLVFEGWGNIVRGIFDKAKEWFHGLIEGVNWVRDRVGDVVGFIAGIPGKIAGLAGSMAKAGLDLGKTLIENVIRGLGVIGSFVSDMAKAIHNAAAKFVNDQIIERVNNLHIEILGKTIDFPNLPKIPLLARGGPYDGPFIAGERGPELVIPNSSTTGQVLSNQRTLELLEAIAGRSGGSNAPLIGSQTIVGLTPEQVTAATLRAHRKMALAWEVS